MAIKTRNVLRWGLLAVGLTAALWYASLPTPVGPASGTLLQQAADMPDVDQEEFRAASADSNRSRFRIATFNIHSGRGVDGRGDLDRVAESLHGIDFAALEEVRGPRLWQALDQAGELGRRLGMRWLFAPNTRHWFHLDSGNGLLSAWPVTAWQRIPLSNHGGRGYRNAVLADMAWNGRTIHILLTHVSRSNDHERQEQLRTVIALFQRLAEPAILLGDLNSPATDPQMAELLTKPGVIDAVGKILGPKNSAAIDWIVVRGLKVSDAGTRDNGASDHPLVWAELEIEP